MKRPKKLAPWVLAFPEQARKLRPVKPKRHWVRSVSPRQSARTRKYLKILRPWMAKHKICEWCDKPETWDMNPLTNHHERGKDGDLLFDTRFFHAVHLFCHIYIGDHPNEARARGLLCAKGDWGRQEP